ncbi:heparan sulfate glucosamine 3-O-sulfotransferase 1-like [Daphnia carinata]|uniref:heparan sulfate glucosamine 3-O-sulfotransferase 1-like n=1 Tax=Daphnia carinata TaxID=120202 RepID=UPI00257CC030|nr:heparan sulfate glucosamine 3-O-sulfotransferase 1-like [Daphnia carinata]
MGRRRSFGSRLLAGLALASMSICLVLLHQLSQDGKAAIGGATTNEAIERRQRHSHRYLLMAAAGSGSIPAAASGLESKQRQPIAAAVAKERARNQVENNNQSSMVDRRLPRLLIIGVRKGGTRALLEMLNLHRDIAMVPVEVHFFDKFDNYQRGLDWYRSQMPLSSDAQLTVEKSPSYYVTPEVPERVYAMNPHVQLVLIVRDPVTRLLSDFAQIEASRAAQNLPNRRFQDVALLPNGEVNTQNRALHVSLYAKFLSRWLHVFPRRQLHIVDGDRLIQDPWPELQKVERFLGLDHLIRRDQFYFNATKGFYCLTGTPADVSNGNDNLTLATAEEHHNHHYHHKCLAGSKGRRHPQVPDEVISVLRQFFAPHNRKFFAMVGQDFDWPEQ